MRVAKHITVKPARQRRCPGRPARRGDHRRTGTVGRLRTAARQPDGVRRQRAYPYPQPIDYANLRSSGRSFPIRSFLWVRVERL